jgi:hypothetical protein
MIIKKNFKYFSYFISFQIILINIVLTIIHIKPLEILDTLTKIVCKRHMFKKLRYDQLNYKKLWKQHNISGNGFVAD